MFISKPFQLLSSPDRPTVMSECNYVNMPHGRLCSVFGHYLRPGFRKPLELKATQVNHISEKCRLGSYCPFRYFKHNVKENNAVVPLSRYDKQVIST
jgi:hypothetical protein